MEGKKIDVYHKGIKQTIKVFDNTSEEDLTNFIKKIFHLNVNNSHIFFQDEEGNFLLIPKIIPNGLKVYLYIESEYKQDISQIKPIILYYQDLNGIILFLIMMEKLLYQMMDMFWGKKIKIQDGLLL